MNEPRLHTGGIRVSLTEEGDIQRPVHGKTQSFPIANEAPERIKTLKDLALCHISLE